MNKYENNDIEEIKSHLMEYINENRSFKGVNFSCFNGKAHSHNDKHPSSAIVPGTDNKLWKCFTCGEAGDIFKAVKLNEGKDFKQALSYLSSKYGVNLQSTNNPKYQTPYHKGDEVEDFSLIINEFHKSVNQTHYYNDRGLSERIINKYRLGFDPIKKGFKYLLPVSNSFITWRSDSVEKAGRYKNQGKTSPFNEIYLKDTSLTVKYIFVVEGTFDALSLEEIGYSAISINSVSSVNHFIELLTLYNENLKDKIIILAGDNDDAGKEMNEKLKTTLTSLNIKSSIYNKYSKLKDMNESLISNRKALEDDISTFLQEVEAYDCSNALIVTESPTTKPIKQIADEFGKSIYIYNNSYYKRTPNGDRPISNFILVPVEIIKNDIITILTLDLISTTTKKIRKKISLEDFMSSKSFKKAINNIDFCFTGTDNDLEYIKSFLAKERFVEKTGVLHTGFYKEDDKWLFVSGDKTINQILEFDDRYVLIENYKELDTSLLSVNSITKEELITISGSLFKFNNLKKTATILAYAASTFLKERLWKSSTIKFPHLLLVGEAGSGKSQTVESIIAPILGLNRAALGASKCTSFTTLKIASSSNTCPLVIEEYKPSQIGPTRVKDISNLLRDIYDHHAGTRGRADQSIVTYNLQSPIIMVGESGTSETAVVERSLQITFSKLDIAELPIREDFARLKNNEELLNKFGRALLNEALMANDEDLLNLYKTFLDNKVDVKIIAPRVRNSVACCLLGLSLIKRVFNRLGLNMSTATGIDESELIEAINNVTFSDLLNDNPSSKSAIDQTLEIFDRMAENELLVENVDYAILKGSILALRINKFYDRFTKYVGECRIETEMLPQSQFTQQLRRTSYFHKYDNARFVKYENGREIPDLQKAYFLDINALKEKGLDLNKLIQKSQK